MYLSYSKLSLLPKEKKNSGKASGILNMLEFKHTNFLAGGEKAGRPSSTDTPCLPHAVLWCLVMGGNTWLWCKGERKPSEAGNSANIKQKIAKILKGMHH